jgi:exonuclease III
MFSLLNIRSIVNRLDYRLEVRRDRSIDVLCLVETWHEVDSATFRRLLKDGYQVSVGDLATTHGGIALVAAPGVGLAPVTVVDYIPTSFEMACARLTSDCLSGIVVVIYRPGSAAVQSSFFEELAAVFDGIATHQEPVFVVGDLNIRFDRSDTRMLQN